MNPFDGDFAVLHRVPAGSPEAERTMARSIAYQFKEPYALIRAGDREYLVRIDAKDDAGMVDTFTVIARVVDDGATKVTAAFPFAGVVLGCDTCPMIVNTLEQARLDGWDVNVRTGEAMCPDCKRKGGAR